MPVLPDYRVQLWLPGLVDDGFGPIQIATELDLHKNLGWSETANDVGEAFFTLTQGDPRLPDVSDLLNAEAHVQIHRGSDLVWSGRMAESDETETDVVFYCYSQAAELFWLHTPWAWTQTGKTLAQIVDAAWTEGVGKASSRLGWMTKGTIQAPTTVTGGGTAITLPTYEANYKRLLFVMQEMAGLAQSDTQNTTRFEITPAGVFNFWKEDGTERTDKLWEFGGGRVAGYHRIRMPGDNRNVAWGVGAAPNDVLLRKGNQITADMTARGRKEEALFYEWVRDADELDRVNRFRVRRGARIDTQLGLSFYPGAVTPFRATGADYALYDLVPVNIQNGVTDVNATKLVTGQQIVVVRGKEHVRLFLQDNLNDMEVTDS